MDGSVDAEMAAAGSFTFVPGVGWKASLGSAGYIMGMAHTTEFYYYGLVVGSEVDGDGDIYGHEPEL